MCNAVNLSTKPKLTVQITATGARGKSAYEAAVQAGFSGTEPEFGAGLAQSADGAAVLAFPSMADFPAMGRETSLYLDRGANRLYRYSAQERAYHLLGTELPVIAVLSGGCAASG